MNQAEPVPKPNHVNTLLATVKQLNDADALAGVVVVLAGKDKTFRVLSANNSDWSREEMMLAVKQAIRGKPEPAKKKLILP